MEIKKKSTWKDPLFWLAVWLLCYPYLLIGMVLIGLSKGWIHFH